MNNKITLAFWFFTLICSVQFGFANDEPCTATPITVNSSCVTATFSTAGATNSTVPDPGCAGYGGSDRWFSFTMPNYGYHTVLELFAGSMTDGGMAVYAGPDCSSLTLVSCDDNSGAGNMPMITVDDGCGFEFAGATFWVRVWENGNDNNGTFDICAYSTNPPVPAGVTSCGGNLIAGDACCDAILLGENLDGYCGNTGSYNDLPDEINNFCAFLDNNAWLAFVANETSVDISIATSNCLWGNGIQVAILETTDCTNFTVVSNCWNPGTETSGNLVATGLTIGETYYIMVDGWAGDICDYTLGIVSGVATVSAYADDYEICQGESTQLHADVIGSGTYTFNWSPAASLDDPTSPNPIATPNVSTNYTVTITGVEDSIHTVSIDVFAAAPSGTVVNGPSSVCENSTNTIYSVSANDASIYNWSVTGGATIVGGNGLDTIIVDWGSTDGSVCVAPENNCGLAIAECIAVAVNSQPDISVGTVPVGCAPNDYDLTSIPVTNSGGGVGLISYYNTLADATNGTNEIIPPTVSSAGRYYLKMQTGPDCFDIDSADVVIEDPALVVVDPGPECSPNFIDLDNVVINEVNGYPGGTQTYYTDSLDAVNSSSPLVSLEVFNSGTYWVRYETPNGCAAVAPINVVIDITPDITINQPAPLCPGGLIDLDTISYTDAAGATFTEYFFDNQTFALLGLKSLALTNTVVSNTQTYYLCAETPNNCVQIVEIFVTAGVTPDAQIIGGGTFCDGDNVDITFMLNGSGPFDVVYTDGTNNFTLNSISNGHIETVAAVGNVTYSLVSVTDANGCVSNIVGSPVDVISNPAPTGTISGDQSICGPGTINIDFTFSGTGPFDAVYIDGTNSFNINGANSNHTETVTVNSNQTFTLVSVTDQNACAGTISGSATITVSPVLQVINLLENCDPSFTTYTISFEIIGGDPGTYTVTGNTGTLTGNIFTSDPIASGATYSFTISDNSGCPPEVRTGSVECSCGTDAGQMDPNFIEVCEDETAIATFLTGSESLNPGDLFEFVLHDNAGPALGNVFASSMTPEFNFQGGLSYGVTYYISPVAGPDDGSGNIDINHVCFSVSEGTPIVFYELPAATISGDAPICSGSPTDLLFNFSAGIGPFDVIISDGTNNILINGLSDGDTYSINPLSNTTYTIVDVTDSSPAICTGTGSGSATINVNDPPVVNNIQFICNNFNTQYQVTFEISGGDSGSYSVNGGPGNLSGNIFTSDFIDNGVTYSFQVDDNNACGPVDVSGSYVCVCTSNSGEMDNTLLEVCEDQTAVANHITTNLNLDGNDVLGFVLLDQAGSIPGSIMLTNSIPEFDYDPVLTYETEYYIAAVVGDDDGTGFPVLNSSLDPCVSISNVQPVRFSQNPTLAIAGANTICQGESTNLQFIMNGAGPYDVEYSDGISTISLSGIFNGHTELVAPLTTTTYSLVSVSLTDAPFCVGSINTSNNSVTIDVIEIPAITNVITDCDPFGASYTVTFEITGGNQASYNVNGNSGTLNGNIFTSDPLPGGSTFLFQVDDGSGCPPVEITATEFCNCTPDIRPVISVEQTISCSGESDGVLSVSNANGVAPFSFQWSNGTAGDEVAGLATGWHYVSMTDSNNCLSVDSVFLEEPEAISGEIVTVDPSCYGDDDGEFSIENVSGGTGEYSYSIDYYSSYIVNTFYGLPGGVYEVTVEDSDGCTWVDTVQLNDPPQLNLELGEDIILEFGDSVPVNPLVSIPVDSFIWRSSASLACPDCWDQVFSPTETSIYSLEVFTEAGCTDSDQLQITITKEHPIFIPNIFSPNGDGDNDIFTVFAGRGVELITTFRVFDRWGTPVYEAYNLVPGTDDFGWDGRLKGEDMPIGVYVYFIEVTYMDGSTELIKGDVTLMK